MLIKIEIVKPDFSGRGKRNKRQLQLRCDFSQCRKVFNAIYTKKYAEKEKLLQEIKELTASLERFNLKDIDSRYTNEDEEND